MKKLSITLLSVILTMSILAGCGSSGTVGHSASTPDAMSNDLVGATSNTKSSGFGSSFSSSTNSGGSWAEVEGFSSDSGDNNSYNYDSYEEESSIEADNATSVENARSDTHSAEMTLAEEKLVYRCTMSIETLEYEDTMSKLYELIDAYDGIIQQMYENDRANDWYYNSYVKTTGTMTCSLNIRVPSKNYKAMTESLGDIGKIKSKQANVDNISQEYYDTTNEISMLQKEQDRLISMMENAYSIEDMLTIEARLSEVETRLNRLQTNIRYMDMDVAYSYINLDISEVMEYTEHDQPVKKNTFLDRLHNKIVDTWDDLKYNLEGILFFIIGILPYVVIIGALIVLYRVLLRKKIKDIQEKRKEQRIQSGDLSIKDMSKILADLNSKVEAKDNSQTEQADLNKKDE